MREVRVRQVRGDAFGEGKRVRARVKKRARGRIRGEGVGLRRTGTDREEIVTNQGGGWGG